MTKLTGGTGNNEVVVQVVTGKAHIARKVKAALERKRKQEDRAVQEEEEEEEVGYPTFTVYLSEPKISSTDLSRLVFSRHGGTAMRQEARHTGFRSRDQVHMLATTLCRYQIHRQEVWEK